MDKENRKKEIKNRDENGKSDKWKVPMTMHGVNPGTYNMSMGAPGGTSPDMQKDYNDKKEKPDTDWSAPGKKGIAD